jgi:hypothetical protein
VVSVLVASVFFVTVLFVDEFALAADWIVCVVTARGLLADPAERSDGSTSATRG